MIRQYDHYHLWKLVRKLEWRLFKKEKVQHWNNDWWVS